MSAYEPPTEIDPIFNSLAFQGPNEASLTIAEADERYLARQNVATSVATATSFSAEVAATSFKSLNSGATIFHVENLAGNNAAMTIRNQRTEHNLFYRQFGTTNSHVFTTNGSATTNLTLSNTTNTLSLPTLITATAAGSPVQILSVRDLTLNQNIVFIPSSINNHLNPMTALNDCQIVTGTAGPGTTNLVLTSWSTTTTGVRITPTTVNIGAGGTTNITPTSGILFSGSNAAMTGTFTFSNDIILRATQPTNTDRYLGYTVKQNGTNTAAITTGTAYNNNSTGLSITPGVYIFHFLLYNSKLTAGAGDINEIQVGISTSSSNFVGGDTTIIKGFQTYVATASAQVVMGNASLTFSVPTTATYYFLQQASHTIGATNLVGTTTSYWEYTRVA
jgi:hypothetical protein